MAITDTNFHGKCSKKQAMDVVFITYSAGQVSIQAHT